MQLTIVTNLFKLLVFVDISPEEYQKHCRTGHWRDIDSIHNFHCFPLGCKARHPTISNQYCERLRRCIRIGKSLSIIDLTVECIVWTASHGQPRDSSPGIFTQPAEGSGYPIRKAYSSLYRITGISACLQPDHTSSPSSSRKWKASDIRALSSLLSRVVSVV
jgi:hypothetical protein